MKNKFLTGVILIMAICVLFSGCGKKDQQQTAAPKPTPITQTAAEFPDIKVEADNIEFIVKLYENDTTRALAKQVPATQTGMLLPTSYDMDGIYKYYDIPERYIPVLNIQTESIAEAKAGEMFINENGRLFLYMQDSELSEDLMQVGYVTDMSVVAEALGDSDLQFRISAAQK